jgi:hypothetical protein
MAVPAGFEWDEAAQETAAHDASLRMASSLLSVYKTDNSSRVRDGYISSITRGQARALLAHR